MADKGNQTKAQAQQRARLKAYEAKQQLLGSKSSRRSKDNRLALGVGVLAVLIALGSQLSYFGFGPGQPTASPTSSTNASPTANPLVPSAAIAENRDWTGSMNVNGTSLDLTLDGKNAPQATANFIDLARKGFFTGNSCHRLTTNGIYVLQCGDPKGDGTGGPGYSFGPIENVPAADLYVTGDLAMARQSNNAQSMGSQFFIVYKDSNIPSDSVGGYTVFGHVSAKLSEVMKPVLAAGVSGLDQAGKPATDGKPVLPVKIGAITVK